MAKAFFPNLEDSFSLFKQIFARWDQNSCYWQKSAQSSWIYVTFLGIWRSVGESNICLWDKTKWAENKVWYMPSSRLDFYMITLQRGSSFSQQVPHLSRENVMHFIDSFIVVPSWKKGNKASDVSGCVWWGIGINSTTVDAGPKKPWQGTTLLLCVYMAIILLYISNRASIRWTAPDKVFVAFILP